MAKPKPPPHRPERSPSQQRASRPEPHRADRPARQQRANHPERPQRGERPPSQQRADRPEPQRFERPKKPPLRLQTTTLWEYPSQHYGAKEQGSARYVGATPSYVIWNVLSRYTREGALVIDPMCGSGTTLDVARDLGRRPRGFDLSPYRDDIERADARDLPLRDEEVSCVFIDPPYGDHIDYSDDPKCIGKLSPFSEAYYRALRDVFVEARRVLEPGGVLAVYVCDFFNKREGYAPVGFALFDALAQLYEPIDTVAVVRHNHSLELGNYHKAAEEQNFFLRGFNYLFLVRKPERRSERRSGPDPRRARK